MMIWSATNSDRESFPKASVKECKAHLIFEIELHSRQQQTTNEGSSDNLLMI